MPEQESPAVSPREVPSIAADNLPVPVPQRPLIVQPRPGRRTHFRAWLVLLLAAAVGAGGAWWATRPPLIPAGIAFSNGRLEADEIDISTKFAGRIAEILVDEGDRVAAGQVVARMDTRDLEAQLALAQAQIEQARHAIEEGQAELGEYGAQVRLAAQELNRARALVRSDFETREVLDQRQAQFEQASAAYHGTEAKIAGAQAALAAATHNADVVRIDIADDMLVAPKRGPILYRLANVGEVLPAGGKVFTMLDVTYVYMDVFLPTAQAGRVKIGDEARILLDAAPDRPIPAKVAFISSENQFTPKMVETQSERDKLMFRVRVRIDAVRLHEHEMEVRSGPPGLAYIRHNPRAAWPSFLQVRSDS